MENKENKSKYSNQIKHIQSKYKKFHIDFKIETFDKLQEICKKNNTTLTTVIKSYLDDYIKNNY